MNKQILSLTTNAKIKILSLLQDNPEKLGLYLGLKKGGCAGMEYEVRLLDRPINSADEIIIDEIKFFIDRASLLFLFGMTIDYEKTPLYTGFRFNNPNQLSACGCGESVLLKPYTSA